MATTQFVMAAVALAGVNAALLGVLGAVWLRNYREFRSGLVLGLVAFSAALLVENLVAVVFFLDSMTMFYASDPLVGRIVFVMRTLEFVAIAFLAYVTLR